MTRLELILKAYQRDGVDRWEMEGCKVVQLAFLLSGLCARMRSGFWYLQLGVPFERA
jgi:hypothetical protein